MKLATILTTRLVVVMTLGIFIMGIITFSIIFTSIPDWMKQVEDSLVENEQENLVVRTNNLAVLVTNKFSQTIVDVGIIKNYTTSIYSNEFPIESYYTSYFGVESVDPSVPPGTTGSSNPRYSVWYNDVSSDPNNNPHLDNTSLIDNAFTPVQRSNEGYQFVYIGIDDGMYRIAPWSRLNNYPTLTYTCSSTGNTVVGYDPRCRPWYHDAKQNQDEMRFTEPYNDATTGLVLITASHSISNPTTGEFMGVIGIDLAMSELEETVLSLTILNNGYTYLFDNNGNLVIYPELEKDRVYTILETEFSSQVDRDRFAAILNRMTSGETNQEIFYKNGDKWYITYQPITLTLYGVAMVVPYDDVVESATDMKETVNSGYIGMTVAVGCIAIVMAIIGGYTAKKCSDNIVRQIKDFNNITSSITANKLDVEMGNMEYGSTEFKQIGEKFQMLLDVVRFANSSYYQNDLNKAFQLFSKVEVTLTELGNDKGLGVVYNNKANALTQMDQVENNLVEAEKLFDLAIKNAEKLLNDAKKDAGETFSASVEFFKITLANRFDNLGHYYLVCGNLSKAHENHDKAIELHMQTDNVFGKMKACGNKGLVYMAENKPDEAEEMFKEAYIEASNRYTQNINSEVDISKNTELLQYASMNMGVHYYKMKKVEDARQFLNYALSLTQKIHVNVKNKCEMTIADIYEEHYGSEGKLIAKDMKKKLNIGRTFPKNVIFVLDTSGSMSGSFITTCRNSIMDIITNYLGESDSISLYTFNTNVRKILFKKSVSNDIQEISHNIANNTKAGGTTAFYTAVSQAIDDMNNDGMDNSSQWIVALTDGEDNRSHPLTSEQVARKVSANKVNLIVITVGNISTINDIMKLTDASEKGMHISANGGATAISEAFGQAAAVISNGHVNMEVL